MIMQVFLGCPKMSAGGFSQLFPKQCWTGCYCHNTQPGLYSMMSARVRCWCHPRFRCWFLTVTCYNQTSMSSWALDSYAGFIHSATRIIIMLCCQEKLHSLTFPKMLARRGVSNSEMSLAPSICCADPNHAPLRVLQSQGPD